VSTDSSIGRIVFVELDATTEGGPGRIVRSALPGLVLDQTSLADIRARVGRNGFGYPSTAAFRHGDQFAAANCYRLRGSDSILVAITN
jgi:hypothetical protein